LGTKRIFKCPNCKELHNFTISRLGKDPALPTHGDNAETGIGVKIWALLLGPLLALILIGFFLLFTFQYIILLIIPLAVGIAWPLLYTLYLYRKISEKTDSK
jgi:hypothetical protein